MPDELQALIKSSGGTISQMKRLRSDGTWENLLSDREKNAGSADGDGRKKNDDLLVCDLGALNLSLHLILISEPTLSQHCYA